MVKEKDLSMCPRYSVSGTYQFSNDLGSFNGLFLSPISNDTRIVGSLENHSKFGAEDYTRAGLILGRMLDQSLLFWQFFTDSSVPRMYSLVLDEKLRSYVGECYVPSHNPFLELTKQINSARTPLLSLSKLVPNNLDQLLLLGATQCIRRVRLKNISMSLNSVNIPETESHVWERH